MVGHLDHVLVEFEYQGHWIMVEVALVKWAFWTVGHQILLNNGINVVTKVNVICQCHSRITL